MSIISRDYFNLGRVLEGVLRSPRSLSALSPMLIDLARACGGFGVTLWRLRWIDTEDAEEPTPRTLPETWDEATRKRLGLYVVGQGMERRPQDREAALRYAYEALTLQNVSGLAVLDSHECIVAEDCETDPRVARDTTFHREIRPGSTMATRVRFEDGSWGSVTLYRRTKGAFAPELSCMFRELAGYAPIMYAMLMDRIGLALVEYVSGTLDQTQEGVGVGQTLSPICAKLAEFLECHEVSIFLESAVVPGLAELRATTRLDMIRRQQFRPEENGLTSYVLGSKRSIRVFDLLKAPKEIMEKANWHGRAEVESQVRRDLGSIPEDEYPPVSFVAVPILAQDRVVGVLRCRWRRGSPYYFSDMDIDVLKIAAGRLGVYWKRQQLLEASQSAAASWQRFADRLNALPLRFSPGVRSAEGNEAFQQSIFKAVLSALQASINGADILDIARPDVARRFFVPVVTDGKEWDLLPGARATGA